MNKVLIDEFGDQVGSICYKAFHNREESCPLCKSSEVMKGKTVRWEWHSRRMNKTYALVETPQRNVDNTISKLTIFRDITELKKAEEALRKAHDELELRVKERTAELGEAKEQLKPEISERKQAEKRVKNLELPALHRLFKQGKGYLIIEEKPDTSFKLFCKLLEYGFKGLLISRTHPSHVHEEYNIKDVPIIGLTHVKGENPVVPTNITQLSTAVKDFVEKDVESVIMLEGLEYLISQNGFEVVLRFVESVTDIVTTSKCRLIMPFDALTVSEVELHRLERELNVMNAKEVQVLILD